MYPLTDTAQIDFAIPHLTRVHSLLPTDWRPTFASFVRIGNSEYAFSTNHVLPIQSVALQASVLRKTRLRNLFYTARVDYIRKQAPFIYDSEVEFKNIADSRDCKTIEPNEWIKRRVMFDARYGSDTRHQCAPFLLNGRAYNLNSGKFQSPCVKCHWVFRGLWHYEGSEKPVRWQGWAPLNCGESLACALAYDKLQNLVSS